MDSNRMPRPLLGWPLFPLPDEHGRLDWPDLEASVRQSIRVILSTRPGEQLMCKFARYLAQISRATWHSTGTYLTRRRCVKWGQVSAVMRTTLVPSARSMARLV